MNATAMSRFELAAGAASVVRAAGARGLSALCAWFAMLQLDARERYVSAARDHADFERRLRSWDQHERSRALTALLFSYRAS